ncbi:MAG: hypothetical protein JSW58_04205 [Candidatus Latescibacterota bacterium]|nr:MAG: hypothetical protein JSW58_04205 [Candidatus Latescibacterota bacterium]
MQRFGRAISLLGIFFAIVVSSSHAATWYVKVDGSGDAPTIQAAIEAAGTDDTILVAPGTYTWSNQGTGDEFGMIHIMRGAPPLTVVSEAGPDVTKLDGQQQGRIFFYQGHYPQDPGGLTIEGFTFRYGKATQLGNLVGGGFTAHLSSPIIRNCVFEYCEADNGGAYWFGGQGSPELIDCVFKNNTARLGGAILVINTPFAARISNCEIRHNTAIDDGGAIFTYNAPILLENSIVTFNTAGLDGGGLSLQNGSSGTVTQSTLYKNQGGWGGGIALIASDLLVDHTIVSNSLGGGSAGVDANSTITFSCSDLFANIGGDWISPFADQLGTNGNFSADPLFCSVLGGLDLHLNGDSPCAPGNHPDGAACDLIGALPVDCGDAPTEQRTWGAIKSMYAN